MKKRITAILSFIMILTMSMTGLSTIASAITVKPVSMGTVVLDGSDDLSISEVVPSPNAVTLKWEKYDSRYKILVYRRPAESGGTWTRIAVLKQGTTSYTDKGVTADKTYYYKIKAYYEKPMGDNIIQKYVTKGQYYATVKAALNKPVFKFASNMGKGVVLQWDARSEATGFAIYRSRVGKKNTWTRIATIKSNKAGQYIDTKVNIGETYYYCFKAYKTVGNKTYYSPSSAVEKKVISGVTPPRNFKAVIKSDGIHISYDKVPGVLGYSIYRRESGTDKWIKIAQPKSVNTLKFVDKTAQKGKTYYYTAKSYKTVNGKTTSSKSAKNVVVSYYDNKPKISASDYDVEFSSIYEEIPVTLTVKNLQLSDSLRVFIDGVELTEDLVNDEKALAKFVEGLDFFFYFDEDSFTDETAVIRLIRLREGSGTLKIQVSDYEDVSVEIKVNCPALAIEKDYPVMMELANSGLRKSAEARRLLKQGYDVNTNTVIDQAKVDEGRDVLADSAKDLSAAKEYYDKYYESNSQYKVFAEEYKIVVAFLSAAELGVKMLDGDPSGGDHPILSAIDAIEAQMDYNDVLTYFEAWKK